MAECGGAGQKGQDMAQGTPGVPRWSYRLCLPLPGASGSSSLSEGLWAFRGAVWLFGFPLTFTDTSLAEIKGATCAVFCATCSPL